MKKIFNILLIIFIASSAYGQVVKPLRNITVSVFDVDPNTTIYTPRNGTIAFDQVAKIWYTWNAIGGTWDIVSSGGTDDQTALEVAFTPYLTLGSTDTQTAIEELKDEIDVIGSAPPPASVTDSYFDNPTLTIETSTDLFEVDISSVDTDTNIDSTGIANLGFVAGAHTIDTDTNIDSVGIVSLGFVAGAHTIDTDTHIDSTGIAGLGYVAGSFSEIGHTHTESEITDLDHYDLAELLTEDGAGSNLDADLLDGQSGSYYLDDTDTNIDSTGIAALGYVAGAHTIDTNIDSTGIAALGFVAGAHIDSTDIADMGYVAGGGGGSSPTTLVYKTVDETKTNDAVLTIDTDLQVSLDASSVYKVAYFIITDVASTPDLKYSYTVPSGGTIYMSTGMSSRGGFPLINASTTVANGYSPSIIVITSQGVIETTTAGIFGFNWAQNTSDAGATKVLKSSWLEVTKIN